MRPFSSVSPLKETISPFRLSSQQNASGHLSSLVFLLRATFHPETPPLGRGHLHHTQHFSKAASLAGVAASAFSRILLSAVKHRRKALTCLYPLRLHLLGPLEYLYQIIFSYFAPFSVTVAAFPIVYYYSIIFNNRSVMEPLLNTAAI